MKESFYIILLLSILVIFIILAAVTGQTDLLYQMLFVAVFAGLVVIILYFLRKNFNKLKHWAMHHDFKYRAGYSSIMHAERFNENLHKKFFGSRSIRKNFNNAPAIEGIFNGRELWLYGLVGEYLFKFINGPISNSLGNFSLFQPLIWPKPVQNDNWQKFTGWCLEFKTHRLPISMIVKKKFLGGKDKIDTESITFEKFYQVDVYEGKGTLQLLEPNMMQLIIDSDIAAFEFSDSSVALYYTLYNPDQERLDKMLEYGLKIAEQVNRNFPMGKYEK